MTDSKEDIALQRNCRRGRYATIGGTLRRYRSELSARSPDVESWIRERQSSVNNEPELRAEPDNRTPSDPQDWFGVFDTMEERKPGFFNTFLEQLTKWGMQKVAKDIQKDLEVGEEDPEAAASNQKRGSRSSINSNNKTEGDDSVVVSIPGQNNVVHLHMHGTPNNSIDAELHVSDHDPNREPNETDREPDRGPVQEQNRDSKPKWQQSRLPRVPYNDIANPSGSSIDRSGGTYFDRLEQDPSLESHKLQTKSADKELNTREQGAYKLQTLADYGDGTKECLLSVKGTNVIIHRRIFRTKQGHSLQRGGKAYLCVSGLIRSLKTGHDVEKRDREKSVFDAKAPIYH